MSRTVTALYDTRAEAEAAQQRLASEVSLSHARIIDQESHSSGRADGSLDRVAMSHEDRHAYGEGIRRGGFILTADVGGHEDADKIIRLLEESSSVDLDQRQDQWRQEGWSAQPTQSASGGMATGGATAGMTGGTGSTMGRGGTDRTVAEESIPLVEEQLVVGKREVERGGARVRSYVREVPVHEQVTLREEHVSVERRPLDQRLGAGELDSSDLLRERNVEVTAMGEEAVVAKEARVREEVVVRKTADQHVEQVDETVSRTEVDVDDGRQSSSDRSAFGGFDSDRGPNR